MSMVKSITGGMMVLVMACGCSTTAETCCQGGKQVATPPAAKVAAAAPAKVAEAVPAKAVSYDKPGFVTAVVKGRLWVFADGSEALAAYKASGKPPAEHATRVKAGPDGMTIMATDLSVIDAYLK